MLHHALTRQHADKSTVMTISQSLYCSGQIYAGYCISTLIFCIESRASRSDFSLMQSKLTEKVCNNKYFQRLWSRELNYGKRDFYTALPPNVTLAYSVLLGSCRGRGLGLTLVPGGWVAMSRSA